MPAFAQVYELKDAFPDSALKVIRRIGDTLDVDALRRQSPFLINEYRVLHTEICYKNLLSEQDDTLALAAFGFYDSVVSGSRAARHDRALLFQFARSLYYKAVVESQRGNTTEAFSDFLETLKTADRLSGNSQTLRFRRHNPEYDHFTALVYDQLAWFFYTYDQWEEALECLNMSNEYFGNAGNREGIASNYALMGDVMLAQGDRFVSLEYYQKSDSLYHALDGDSGFNRHNMLYHQALSLYNNSRMMESNRLLNQALREMDEASGMSRQIHFMLGYSYLARQVYDTALYHFEHSHPLLPRQTLKTYCNAVEIANMLGDSIKAAQYGQLLAEFTLKQFYQKGDETKMVTMFEKYKDEKDTAVVKDWFFYIVIFVVLLAVIIALQSLVMYYRRLRSKADQEQHERIKSSLEKQIAMTNAEAKLKEQRISALQLELEKAIANPDFQNLPLSEKMEVLTQMPVSKRALMVLDYNVKAGVSYPELVMSENQMGQLIKAVDAVFPKFSVRMIEQYPRLKRSDVMYCCLYVLGLNEIQAAALTGKTYQAVWKRSAKLHEIFGNKSDLGFILHNIIKSW